MACGTLKIVLPKCHHGIPKNGSPKSSVAIFVCYLLKKLEKNHILFIGSVSQSHVETADYIDETIAKRLDAVCIDLENIKQQNGQVTVQDTRVQTVVDTMVHHITLLDAKVQTIDDTMVSHFSMLENQISALSVRMDYQRRYPRRLSRFLSFFIPRAETRRQFRERYRR